MKSNQHKIAKDKRPKRAAPTVDPDCLYSYRMIPISQAFVDQMTEELIDWPSKNPNAKSISQYYRKKGLGSRTYNRLLNRHPLLKEIHEEVMIELGERLWESAVDNKANWTAVRFRLQNYGGEFDEANKYHAALQASAKKDHLGTDGNKEYVVIYRDRPKENE